MVPLTAFWTSPAARPARLLRRLWLDLPSGIGTVGSAWPFITALGRLDPHP